MTHTNPFLKSYLYIHKLFYTSQKNTLLARILPQRKERFRFRKL